MFRYRPLPAAGSLRSKLIVLATAVAIVFGGLPQVACRCSDGTIRPLCRPGSCPQGVAAAKSAANKSSCGGCSCCSASPTFKSHHKGCCESNQRTQKSVGGNGSSQMAAGCCCHLLVIAPAPNLAGEANSQVEHVQVDLTNCISDALRVFPPAVSHRPTCQHAALRPPDLVIVLNRLTI